MNTTERLTNLKKQARERNAKCNANKDNLIQDVGNQLLDLVEKWFDENPDHFVKNIQIKHTVSADILDSFAKAIGYNCTNQADKVITVFRCYLAAALCASESDVLIKLVEDKLNLTYYFNLSAE